MPYFWGIGFVYFAINDDYIGLIIWNLVCLLIVFSWVHVLKEAWELMKHIIRFGLNVFLHSNTQTKYLDTLLVVEYLTKK